MRRHAIGAIALGLLLIAAILMIWPPTGPALQDLEPACLRIGAVMVLIWLAYDHLQRMPRWLWFAMPVILLAFALRPRYLLLFIPLAIALAVLRPRSSSRRVRRP
jgi:hypothetical protein